MQCRRMTELRMCVMPQELEFKCKIYNFQKLGASSARQPPRLALHSIRSMSRFSLIVRNVSLNGKYDLTRPSKYNRGEQSKQIPYLMASDRLLMLEIPSLPFTIRIFIHIPVTAFPVNRNGLAYRCWNALLPPIG
jgi:hypothetical protein